MERKVVYVFQLYKLNIYLIYHLYIYIYMYKVVYVRKRKLGKYIRIVYVAANPSPGRQV